MKDDDIQFLKDGLYLKTENGFEEAMLYMTYDDARCFDIETSVHICLKKDWDRVHEVSMIKGDDDLETHQVKPVLYSMDYVEEMKEWYE